MNLRNLPPFIVRLLFVPGKDVTYPPGLLAANTALRNGPGKDWSGLGILGTSGKKVHEHLGHSRHVWQECAWTGKASVEDDLAQ